MGRAERLMRCLGDMPEVRANVLDRYAVDRAVGPLEVWERR